MACHDKEESTFTAHNSSFSRHTFKDKVPDREGVKYCKRLVALGLEWRKRAIRASDPFKNRPTTASTVDPVCLVQRCGHPDTHKDSIKFAIMSGTKLALTVSLDKYDKNR